MKIIIFLFLIVHCTLSIEQSFSQWIQQSPDVTASFQTVYFSNENTGIVSGYSNAILKTTNGGQNWITIGFSPLPPGGYPDMSFGNSSTGYITTGSTAMGKTTNSGYNWTFFSGYGGNCWSVFFLNGTTGFIGGGNGVIAKTTNGGQNWITNNAMISFELCSDIYFTNLNTGYAVGNVGSIVKTTNGGDNWFLIPFANSNFHSICFLNSETGYLSGTTISTSYGKVIKTTNGGNSWQRLNIDSSSAFLNIHFIDVNTGYVCGYYGKIFRTSNGGLNWLRQTTPDTTTSINYIYFPNSYTGYIVGEGKILKTTNGGNVFVKNISNDIPKCFSLLQNYPNPFNPTTSIKYQVESIKFIKLVVYDVLGKEVAPLVNEKQSPGTYEVSWDATAFPSGVYFYKLTTGDFSEIKKALLIK